MASLRIGRLMRVCGLGLGFSKQGAMCFRCFFLFCRAYTVVGFKVTTAFNS